MTIFSEHAPTGQSAKTIVSANEYSNENDVGFPENYTVYVNKILEREGTSSITESRTVNDLVGSRLYLYHRIAINNDGTISSVSVSDGAIDAALTNPRQGYIVFTTLPTSDFTVTYQAAPDCYSNEFINNVQDNLMEIEQVLGVSNQTGAPGLRNLAFGVFDKPNDENLSGVAQRAVYLAHLAQDITIGSTDDSNLTGTLGNAHVVQIGRGLDRAEFDVTGFNISQSDASQNIVIRLGNKTGDTVFVSGQVETVAPVTVGGPAWPTYSGTFGGDVNGAFYSGAMLRVRGDCAVLGDLNTVGSITVVNLTGEVSTIIGDFTVTDEFQVNGTSDLIGTVTTNALVANQNITYNRDIVAGNAAGHSLVDNLDASEVAHTYNTVTKRVLPNSVISARPFLDYFEPVTGLNTFYGRIGPEHLAGDIWQMTGFATANAGPSGAHPNIVQVNFDDRPMTVVANSISGYSSTSGVWSRGLMDPGTLYVESPSDNFVSPTYGYTIESGNSSSELFKLNVFCPEFIANQQVQTNSSLLLYNPFSRPWDYITAAGGASPSFTVFGSNTYPLEVSFDNEVRKMTATSASVSMQTALEYSVSGLGTPATGVAYIFAVKNDDPELAPSFKARNIPYPMPNEVALGEVTALVSGSTWTVMDTTCYRPQGVYDSSWLPAVSSATNGRAVPLNSVDETVIYFNHNLGPVNLANISSDLYLGYMNTGDPVRQTHPLSNAIGTSDQRSLFSTSGTFTKVPLTTTANDATSNTRDASVCYLDSRLVGISFSPGLLDGVPSSGTPDANYLRLVIKRLI